jgi:hypothetical protein
VETIEDNIISQREALEEARGLSRRNEDITFYVKKRDSGYFIDASHYHQRTEAAVAAYRNGIKTTWP